MQKRYTPDEAFVVVKELLTEAYKGAPRAIPEKVIRDVAQAHIAPNRFYHYLSHPVDMFETGRNIIASMTPADREMIRVPELYGMIAHHDVFCEPGRKDNEERSATWAKRDAENVELGIDYTKCVSAGINATKNHKLGDIPLSWSYTIGLLLDLDLKGLGGTQEEFAESTELVWQEYQHFVDRPRFNEGRRAWAQQFLDGRKRIFQTKYLAHLEPWAIINMTRLARG